MDGTKMDEKLKNAQDIFVNESPFYLSNFYDFLCNLLEHYGWFILVGVILFYYLWSTKIHPLIEKWFDQRRQQEYDEKYHKNPDLFIERQIQLEKARHKLQRDHDLRASVAEEKRKEREEKKKEEWLTKQDPKLFGNKLNNKNEAKSQEEYNPLMGEQRRNYRPSRRSGCSSGGCK